MSLLDEVRRVAKEFEYPPEEVNKGVKEFIRQMGLLQWFSASAEQKVLITDILQTKVCKGRERT